MAIAVRTSSRQERAASVRTILMMTSGVEDRSGAVDALLASARRALLMLVIAIGAADDEAAAVAAARLRWAIGSLRPLSLGPARARRLDAIANRAQRYLGDEPVRPLREVGALVDRIARRRDRARPVDARHACLAALDLDDLELGPLWLHGAQITDTTARRARCAAADATATRWLRCRLDAMSLTAAVLGDARFEHCSLVGARLDATSWHRAQVAHCDLRGATLADARLDRALFSDCDLRGADLRIVRSPDMASLAGARFVRCDLRGSAWDGRACDGASFVDCTYARGPRDR